MKDKQDHMIVIGVSAGGPRALQQLFTQLSSVGNIAFVLVIHQAIDQSRLLVDLVGRHAKLNIKAGQKKSPLVSGSMLVMPPSNVDKVDGFWFLLADHNHCYSLTPSIKLLFESRAQHRGERAVVIVIYGTGSHGTRSFRAVTVYGGILLGQSPERAQFNATPTAVIAQGERDLVAGQATLCNYLNRLSCKRGNKCLDDYSILLSLLLRTRLANVRRSYRIDPRRYKEPTLLCQIERWRSTLGYPSIEECLNGLPRDLNKANELAGSLLVSITGNIRDPDVYSAITEKLGCLIARPIPGQTMRGWTRSCDSVEQVYALRVIISHVMDRAGEQSHYLTIFCFDLIDQSLNAAINIDCQFTERAFISNSMLEHMISKNGSKTPIEKEVSRDIVIARLSPGEELHIPIEGICIVRDQYQIEGQKYIGFSHDTRRLKRELNANQVYQHVSMAKLDMRSEKLGGASDELQRKTEHPQLLNKELQTTLVDLQTMIKELMVLIQDYCVKTKV
jgi:two-component system CheB/CheR fusion protein